MSNSGPWGNALQTYRKQAQLTQGQFIKEISLLLTKLSEAEKTQLVDAQIYEEATTYFGGILDAPTLSRLEKGTRSLNLRQRCVALVWGLNRLGQIGTIDEANRFLEMGGHGNLTAAESVAIFQTTPPDLQIAPVPIETQSLYEQIPADASNEPLQRALGRVDRLRLGIGAAGIVLLAAFVAGLLNWLPANDLAQEAIEQATQAEGSARNNINNAEQKLPTAGVTDPTHSIHQSSGQIKQHALLVDDLISESGMIGKGQTLSHLHEMDLQGDADIWENYVKFVPVGGEPYVGFRVFSVPQHIPRNAVSAIRVEANYRGPAIEGQLWTWYIFNIAAEKWERVGDNRDTPWWGEWHLLSFNVVGRFADYINEEDKILLQVQANNESDGMDLDYEAIIIEWPPTP